MLQYNLIKPSSGLLQTHSDRHVVAQHEQDGRQLAAEHLDVGEIGQTGRLILISVFRGNGQGGKENSRLAAVIAHELVEN